MDITPHRHEGLAMKKRLGPVERLFPMPCPIVVGGTMENAGALAVAWINVVSSTPPTVAMGLRESRHTLELIEAECTFTVNVPRTSQATVVDYLGLATGRHVDKLAVSGLTLQRGSMVETPIIVECPFNLECKVTEQVTVGSYQVIFGEILEAHVDKSVLVDPEGDEIDIEALDPLIYCAGIREYRRIGGKIGDAFSIGRNLMGRGE